MRSNSNTSWSSSFSEPKCNHRIRLPFIEHHHHHHQSSRKFSTSTNFPKHSPLTTAAQKCWITTYLQPIKHSVSPFVKHRSITMTSTPCVMKKEEEEKARSAVTPQPEDCQLQRVCRCYLGGWDNRLVAVKMKLSILRACSRMAASRIKGLHCGEYIAQELAEENYDNGLRLR